MHQLHTPEYEMIRKHYGDRTAARSGVPLINHIHEGLTVLRMRSAGPLTKRAWCMHPLIQDDHALVAFMHNPPPVMDFRVMVLVMEYRSWANQFLSNKVGLNTGGAYLRGTTFANWGPLLEVKDMLVADKVQNRKDFETYHKATHERSRELDFYFRYWLDVLGVSESQYERYCQEIDRV